MFLSRGDRDLGVAFQTATLAALRVLPIKLLGITRETLKGRSARVPMKVLLGTFPLLVPAKKLT